MDIEAGLKCLKENNASCIEKETNLQQDTELASSGPSRALANEQGNVLLEISKNSQGCNLNTNESLSMDSNKRVSLGFQKGSDSEQVPQRGIANNNNAKEKSSVSSGSVQGDQGTSILNAMCLISDPEELKGNRRGISYARRALKNKNVNMVESMVLHIKEAIQFSDSRVEGRSGEDNASLTASNAFVGLYTNLPSVVGPIILATSLRRLQRKGIINNTGDGVMVKSSAGDYPSILPQEVDQEELFKEFCEVRGWCIPFIDQRCNRLGERFLQCSLDFASSLDLWIEARKDAGASYWRSTRKWKGDLHGSSGRYVFCLLLLLLSL